MTCTAAKLVAGVILFYFLPFIWIILQTAAAAVQYDKMIYKIKIK